MFSDDSQILFLGLGEQEHQNYSRNKIKYNEKISKGMQYPNESGFDDFTKPALCTENLPATLPKSSARRQHWGQGFPLQARFDIKTLCLRETPALPGGCFTAARGGEALRSGV